mmetsp:Transcript_85062/g.214365  ORF Transcript_85062/g.214365 Transcript_85062/m.214365 type:complete len:251 (-) Transcript_85062:1028-1780(-)
MFLVGLPYRWIEDSGDDIFFTKRGRRKVKIFGQLRTHLLEVSWLHAGTWPTWQARLALENGIEHLLRKAVVRCAQPTLRHVNGAARPADLCQLLCIIQVSWLNVVKNKHKCDVPHHFGGWRDLYDVAAKLVHDMVHLNALLPPRHDTERFALRVKVGVLPSRNLVMVNTRGASEHAALVDAVELTDPHPIVVKRLEGLIVDLRVAWVTLHRCTECVERWLARRICDRGHAAIDNVTASVGHSMQCRKLCR